MTDDPQRPNDAPPALVAQIVHHWETYRPRMSREMKAAGTFEDSVRRAASMTADAIRDLITKHGLAPDQARELVREEWAFLTEEDEDAEA